MPGTGVERECGRGVLEVVKQVLRLADNARNRLEKDIPVILKAICEIESSLFRILPPSNNFQTE
jgi:hypothetical protein